MEYTDIRDYMTLEQQEIEKMFGAAVFLAPWYSLSKAGWLSPSIIVNEEIREFWKRVLDRTDVSMTQDDARSAVAQIALETNVFWKFNKIITGDYYPDLFCKADMLAAEIAKRAYNVKISVHLAPLKAALEEGDHQKIREEIQAMAGVFAPLGSTARTSEDVHDAFMEFLQSEQAMVVPTSMSNLDEALGGWPKRNLIVIGARPSMGKTAIAWQSARDAAQEGHRVYFCSLEMGEIDLWMRAACPAADVLHRDVIARRLSGEQVKRLKDESALLKEYYGKQLAIDDRPQTTDSIWQYATAHRPDLIVVDHLRLLRDHGHRGELEAKRQGRIAENLKEIAKSCNCAVLCLAQLNRGVEGRADKRPGLSDLRDSGEIEENADVIAFIHSPDYYDPLTGYKPKRNIELWIDKNRNGGRLIQVNLVYDLRQQNFTPAQVTKTNL